MTETCSGQCQSETVELKASTVEDNGTFDKQFTSEFIVPKMDCPSEERLIRLTLDSVEPSVGLLFDIPARKVRVFHDDNLNEITTKLESLNFGAKLETTQKTCGIEVAKATVSAKETEAQEMQILKWLLAINGFVFVVEIIVGWMAQSAGLKVIQRSPK